MPSFEKMGVEDCESAEWLNRRCGRRRTRDADDDPDSVVPPGPSTNLNGVFDVLHPRSVLNESDHVQQLDGKRDFK